MGCKSFAKKFLQNFCKQPVKGNLHILVFLNYTSGYLKFCKTFCIFEMAWSRRLRFGNYRIVLICKYCFMTYTGKNEFDKLLP